MRDSWKSKKLRELYSYSSGLSKSADQFGFGYPFLSYKDIFNNAIVPFTLSTLVNSTEKDRETCSIKRGDVFLTRTSETTEELGMSSVALIDYPNATFNGFTKRLRPFTDEVAPEFASYYFRSPLFRAQVMGMASLITRASLNSTMMDHLTICYPSKECQIKIGSLLKCYDDLIEKNNRKIAILQEQAQEIYKEWFVRFSFPGHKTVKFENGLPEGWKNGRIEDLCVFTRGRNITADEMQEGSIPVISAGIEPSGCHNEANVNGISITASSSGANAGFLSIHYSDIWAADCSFVNDKANIYYLYELFNSIRPCIFNLQRGAAQPHVYPKDINRLKLTVPSEDLQIKFNAVAEIMHSTIAALMKENAKLSYQRDLLLPRLMSGKLGV